MSGQSSHLMCGLQEPSYAWPGCPHHIWVTQTTGWKDITTLISHLPDICLGIANL